MEHFIEAVRRYPCLWDTAAPEYRDQELKDAAWGDLVKETDLTSVKEVKLKWKKLRDSYRDALKRQSEVAAGGKRGSAWKYTHLMHFLQPHMNARKKPPFPQAAPREPSAEVGEGERVNGHEGSEDSCSSRSSTPRRRRTRPASVKRPLSPRHLELPDPLDIFFNSMCQSTKRLPYPAQIKIKKALFAAVIEAEEGLLAEQQNYAALWARGAASTSGSEPAGQHDDVKPYP
ncbi:unnamed protein product [Pieris macdunnoughi]|uniref:MADF domain-containing protein n=1 Tax=Pieris macdunnoughi TaxID=345717 RepID=A0A821WIM5_9NEOP|nr:unnamed protein product [Pieris macdunnoughi]